MSSTWDSPHDSAPAGNPGAAAVAPTAEPELERPRRRGEIHSISQLSTDEIVAELDRRERRTRQLLTRQEALRAELVELDRQIADIGDSLPALEAAARSAPAGHVRRGAAEDAPRRRRTVARAKNDISLADAIAAAVEVRAEITPAEAAELVIENGYRTNASKFTMTVANALAKDKRFLRKERGKYVRIA